MTTPSSSYWPTPTMIRPDCVSAAPGPDGRPRLSFSNLSIASTTVTFWALKIIISSTIASVCSTIALPTSCSQSVVSLNAVGTISTGLEGITEHSDPASSPDEVFAKAQRLSNEYNFAQRKDIATLVIQSMPYCLNFNMGLLGPQKAFFALRTALSVLKSNPSPEQTWVKSNHKRLAERYVEPIPDGSLLRRPILNMCCSLPNTFQYHLIYEFFLATFDELSTSRPLYMKSEQYSRRL